MPSANTRSSGWGVSSRFRQKKQPTCPNTDFFVCRSSGAWPGKLPAGYSFAGSGCFLYVLWQQSSCHAVALLNVQSLAHKYRKQWNATTFFLSFAAICSSFLATQLDSDIWSGTGPVAISRTFCSLGRALPTTGTALAAPPSSWLPYTQSLYCPPCSAGAHAPLVSSVSTP